MKRIFCHFALVLVFMSISYFQTAVAHGQSSHGSDLLSCSPAPCVLPPVQATEGSLPVVDSTIVADPANPNNLALGTLDGNCHGGSTMAFQLSTDAGSTWKRTNCMGSVNTELGLFYPGGQPMVGYDLHGNAYIAGEYIDSKGVGFGLVLFQKSSDGMNWSQPALALTRGYELLIDASLTIDTNPQSPRANNLYVSAVAINEPSQRQNQVFVSHSSDGGSTWIPVAVEPAQFYPALDRYTNMTVNKDGTLYVTWQHCATSGPAAGCKNGKAYMLFSKSSDGGSTWSSPAIMTTITVAPTPCDCATGNLPNTNDIPVTNYPVIGVDNSNGPYSGNLYVTMYSWTGSYMQVQVVHSTDGGNTWSHPVPVAPASDTHDQFFPWLAVSSTGLIGVNWLDRRNDPSDVNYQAFAAISKDGGQTFQPNVQLTQKFSNPNIGGENYMGDYIGASWVGPTFVSAWMDSSNGVNMQDVVGGVKLH